MRGPMRVRLILFDIDGTLVDLGGAGRQALLVAFERLFRPSSLTAAGRVRFAGRTDLAIFRDMAREAGIDEARFLDRSTEFESAYTDALRDELTRTDGPTRRVLPGVTPLLKALSARDDAKLGLLTGNIASGARLKLEAMDLMRYFDGGGFGDDAEDRRGVARAARRDMVRRTGIEFTARDVIVVGDTEEDVDCARANGFRAIAVDTGWAEPGRLPASRPTALFDDLSDTDAVLRAVFED